MWIENVLFQLFSVHSSKGERSRSKRRAFVDRQKISRQSLIRKLTRPSEEREWLSRNCMKLMLKLRQEIDIAFHEINQESESQRFQLHRQISLKETKSACMENWNWEIDSSKTIMQETAKKLKNWEELIAKKQIEQDKQALMNCLCIKRGILRLWVNFLTQIQDLQNKVNSLTDAREFHNPESGISSGATHVPDQTSTILSPRTLPRCDSGMPRDTQCGTGITGNVFERPRAEEGLSSTICKNSKNLASSSQWLRPDTTGIARKRDDEMKREPLSVPSPHFESKSCMLDHTGGTSSHNGMMDYPRFPISELHLGKIPDSMKVQSWKVNQLQDWSLFEKHILLSQCSGSKKLRLQNQLMNFEHRDRLWSTISTISICLMRWLRLHWESFSTSRHFSKRECRRAACLETRPILTWETNCLHGIRAFPCNRSLWSRTRTLKFVRYKFTEWRRKISTLDGTTHYNQWVKCPQMWSWKDCTSQNYRILFNFKLCWLCMIKKRRKIEAELSTIENSCKTSFWPDDENSKLQGQERCCGKWTKRQKGKKAYVERKVGKCFQWKAHG